MELSSTTAALVSQFETFEDYLDNEVTETDMDFLGSLDVARQLVGLQRSKRRGIIKRAI